MFCQFLLSYWCLVFGLRLLPIDSNSWEANGEMLGEMQLCWDSIVHNYIWIYKKAVGTVSGSVRNVMIVTLVPLKACCTIAAPESCFTQ